MSNSHKIQKWSGFWDVNKSRYEEIDELALMATPWPVCGILILYFLFVAYGLKFMRNRKAFKLKSILVVHNIIQVGISIYLTHKYFQILRKMGLASQTCYMEIESCRKEIIFIIWLYFLAKLTELIDTVMIILRKKDKQMTFLHLYHHSFMVTIAWVLLKYWPSQTLAFTGFMNSLVHVFMYTYFGLSVFGPRATKYWSTKKHITQFQLVQFLMLIIQYIASVRVIECPPPKGVAITVVANMALFFILFANFYDKSYNNSKVTNVLKLKLHKNV